MTAGATRTPIRGSRVFDGCSCGRHRNHLTRDYLAARPTASWKGRSR
jgi:hypothetical protein